jgi:hypothetical protein
MTTTVIGVYDEFQPAFSAKNALLAAGFSWTRVQLNPDHEVPLRERTATPHTDPNSVNFNISSLFTGLLGAGNTSTHSNVYAEAVRRGGYVVTIDFETEDERARADEIVRRFGPVNVEVRSSDWLRHGWRGHEPGASGQ